MDASASVWNSCSAGRGKLLQREAGRGVKPIARFRSVRGATLGDARSISTETTPWSCIWWKNLRIKRLFQIGCLFDTQKNRVVTSNASLAPEG